MTTIRSGSDSFSSVLRTVNTNTTTPMANAYAVLTDSLGAFIMQNNGAVQNVGHGRQFAGIIIKTLIIYEIIRVQLRVR